MGGRDAVDIQLSLEYNVKKTNIGGISMKLMIASDLHGSAHWCRKLLDAFDREGADRLLLLGDLLYHGPRNPLPEGYAPMEVVELLNARRGEIFCVRGNCDSEVDQMMLQLPILADYCLVMVGKRCVFATHGHHHNTEALPPLRPGDILLHGHTHLPAWEVCGEGNFYFNPGSVSLPKEGTPHGYMIFTEREAVWKTMDGEIYHTQEL